MHFRVLGWAGFAFLAVGVLILLFGPSTWRNFGCGALLTAVTLYIVGLILVARQIAAIRRKANEMMQRVAEEMEHRQGGGGKKVIDIEKVDPDKEKSS
jgi:hypothetical protein